MTIEERLTLLLESSPRLGLHAGRLVAHGTAADVLDRDAALTLFRGASTA